MNIPCENCKYCVYQDYGYSNWTVEGTTVGCGKGKFEAFDRFYGEAPENSRIPNPCSSHEVGFPIELDVDGEVWKTLSDEERVICEGVV